MKTAFSFLLIFSVVISCNNPIKISSENKTLEFLDENDKKVCDLIGFDTIIASKIRNCTDNLISVFKRNPEFSIASTQFDLENKTLLPGLSFNEKSDKAAALVDSLSDEFYKKGYLIFISEMNFGNEHAPDQVGVLKTKNSNYVLKFQQTNGANYNIDNDSLIALMKMFEQKYSLRLNGAGPDWCQYKILAPPANWLDMAKEVYKFCPDVVEQGADNVENLADEMQSNRILYFWWD